MNNRYFNSEIGVIDFDTINSMFPYSEPFFAGGKSLVLINEKGNEIKISYNQNLVDEFRIYKGFTTKDKLARERKNIIKEEVFFNIATLLVIVFITVKLVL